MTKLVLQIVLMLSFFSCGSLAAFDTFAVSIRNVMGFCLDVVNSNVQLASCKRPQINQWLMQTSREELKQEFYSISSNGRCLDVSGGVNANRSNLQLYRCNETNSQMWKVTKKGEFRNIMGRCLEVAGGVNKIGTNIQLYDCNSTRSQFFQINPRSYQFKNVMGYCLANKGNNVKIEDCRYDQQWFMGEVGSISSKYMDVVSTTNYLCLDIVGGINGNRTNIQTYACNGTASQKWKLTKKGELRNIKGRCLEIAGGVNKNGTNVQLYDCNSTRSQIWEKRSAPIEYTPKK